MDQVAQKPNGQQYNLLALPKVERPVHTRTFTDPDFPGLEVTLKLRRPGALQQCEIADVRREETARWVTGRPEEGIPAMPFIVGEEAVSLPERFIATCCLWWGMQADRKYSLHELYGLFISADEMWFAVDAWVSEILKTRPVEPGKSPGAPKAPSSSSESTTSTPTPGSSSEPTASSGASTSG